MEEVEFTVQCNVCSQQYNNWVGSTPCCGSIAYQVDKETGEVSKNFFLFAQVGKEKIKAVKIT